MKIRPTLISGALGLSSLVSIALTPGCDNAGAGSDGDPASLGMTFATLGTCTATGNGDGTFPAGADRVVIHMTGGPDDYVGSAAPSALVGGSAVYTDITPGTYGTMRVVACSATTPVWVGETRGVTVAEHQKSFPHIFLSPVGDYACTSGVDTPAQGRQLSEARGWAAMAGDGETTWVAGGISGYASTVGTASDTVDVYDRATGAFSTTALDLRGPRAGAAATFTDAGNLLVVGGTEKLSMAGFGKPPIWTESADAPDSAGVLIDPVGNVVVEIVGTLPARPDVGVLPSNTIVAIGGVDGSPSAPSVVAARVAADGTLTKGTMAVARYGSAVVPLSENIALIWGGNADGDVANIGAIYDATAGANTAVVPLTVTGATDVPAFATGAVYDADGQGNPRVLIIGGTTIDTTGNYQRDVTSPRSYIVTVDVAARTADIVALDASGVAGLADIFTRADASLTVLADGSLWLTGGYTAFAPSAVCPGSTDDCIPETTAQFSVSGGGAPVIDPATVQISTTVGPLGGRVADLSDGAWLMTGGIETLTATELGKEGALARFDTDGDGALCAQ